MDRSLARLAAALLLGTALTACSTFDSGTTAASSGTEHAQAKTAANKGPTTDLDTQIRAAQDMRVRGDYQGATGILSQLMMVAPDNAGVVGEYGKTLVGQGRSKEALDFLRRAVQLQPRDWSLYSATGVAYDQGGDYASARLAYQQALALKPGDAGVLNNYALSRMQAGDIAGARQLMSQAQATGASDPKIAQNVALIASYAPAEPAPMKSAVSSQAPAPAQSAPKISVARVAPPPRPVPNTIMMQQVPVDSKAGPVKTATAAPRKLVKEQTAANAPKPAATAKKETTTLKKAAAVPVASKKTAEAAAAKTKTPSLRMTADASSP